MMGYIAENRNMEEDLDILGDFQMGSVIKEA